MVLHTDDDVTVDQRAHPAGDRRRRADGRGRRPRRPHRQHADDAARPHRPRPRLPPARQARALQPRLLVEGPAGAADDRERRGRRPAAARRHDRRAHQRQHRRRASPSWRPGAGYKCIFVCPDKVAPRQDRPAARLRRRGDRVPDVGRPRAPRLLLLGVGPAGPRGAGRVEARPVPQPRQPAGAVRDDRPGDLGADRRAASPTSCAASAPAARSPASAATSRSGTRRSAPSAPTPRAPCTPAAPAGPYLVEGIGEDFWPTTYDPSVVDEVIPISDAVSFGTARRVTREEGLLIGGSGGTAIAAALQGRAPASRPTRWSSCTSPTRAAATCRSSTTTAGWPTTASCAPPGPPSATCCAGATRRCPRSCTPTPTRRCARPSRSCASSR